MSPVLQQVKHDAARVVRNLPAAHGGWQFWRNAAFRGAIRDVVNVIYTLDVESFTDEHFAALENAVRAVIKVIDIHVSGLGDGVHDVVDREFFRDMCARLTTALDGFEQGLPADPSKRPDDEQLMARLNAGLRRAKIA